MSMVAAQLRQAREAQSLTIHQVAEATKIRTDHIRALEAGNFNVFSAPVYIKGSVKNYAAMLKLDVPQIMAALNDELSQSEKFHEPPPLTDEPRGAMDFITLQLSKIDLRKGAIVLGAAVVLILIVGIIAVVRHRANADPLAGLPSGVYQNGNPSGDTLPVPPPRQTR
jgi:cytoskeleton protein RodZ